MPALSVEAIGAQIRAAWANAVRPPDKQICAPTYDDEGVGAYFAGRPWHGHDVKSLRWHSAGLSFFSAEGFCYYLPAYLMAVLEDIRAADVIYDSILFHLSPAQLGKQWADSYRARIAGFDEAQKRAIIAYLEWCRELHGEPDGREQGRLAETISYLETGEVRGAESAVDRLLELGGQRGRSPEDVTWLSLSHTKVRDRDLVGLAAFRDLRELDLGGAQLSDAGLAQLSTLEISTALAKLEKLDLSNGKQFSADGLVHLNALCNLAQLRLPNSELDDDKLAALDALALRSLDLTHSRNLTDRGWLTLEVRRLEELSMYGVDAPDALMARLGDAGVLRELTCNGVTEAGVIALASRAKAPALTALKLSKASSLGDPALAALAELPALADLQLGEVDARSWPGGFPALVEVTLLSGSLSAEAAGGLAELPVLAELSCFGERLAPGALAALSRSRSLRRLTLSSDALDDAGFLELAGSAVERLTVRASRLGDAALGVLAQLPRLEELHLTNLSIDDDGLAHLASATSLRALHLDGIPISNAGLRHLASCTALRTLRLAGTKVTSTGLAVLKRTLRSLEVAEL